MRLEDRHAVWGSLLIAGAIALLLVGCSSDRVGAPSSHESSASDQFILDQSAELGQGPGLAEGPDKSLLKKVVKVVNGVTGGEIRNGRYVVKFAPGAFSGSREITISDPGNGYVECRLYPEGLPFSKDVTLTMNLTGTTGSGDTKATIYWFDPNTGAWVDIGGRFDRNTNTVSAKLTHFSTYRAGRAGW